MEPQALLRDMIMRRAGDARAWVTASLDALAAGAPDRDLHVFLGFAPRRLGKRDLDPSPDERVAASGARDGWDIGHWSLDGAARTLALLVHASERNFVDRFRDLRRTADLAELVALYRGLPLYPDPGGLHFEVGEGLRSNVRAVFEAIAQRNPFPREHFDQHRWNHMILKALFVDSRLAPIQGLDERANAELAQILRGYAHERWAAGRPVTPELWRCVGPFAEDAAALEDLKRALGEGGANSRAAALALAASPAAAARDLLAGRPETDEIEAGRLDWTNVEAA